MCKNSESRINFSLINKEAYLGHVNHSHGRLTYYIYIPCFKKETWHNLDRDDVVVASCSVWVHVTFFFDNNATMPCYDR